MRIGQIAEKTGLAPSAIRYYEEQKLLKPPARISGKRSYAPSVLNRLAMIQLAQSVGFRIAEIRELLRGFDTGQPSQKWLKLARRKLEELDAQVLATQSMATLLTRAIDCGCSEPLACPAIVRPA